MKPALPPRNDDEGLTQEESQKAGNVARLLTMCPAGESTADDSLGMYLEEIKLIGDTDEGEGLADSVSLMTIHAAKGLGFQWFSSLGSKKGLSRQQYS